MPRALPEFVYTAIGRFLPNIEGPTFIVGSGRCGTSLLVSMLTSHPALTGVPGEANHLWHPYAFPFRYRSIDTPSIIEDPRTYTERSLASWPSHHDDRIQRFFTGYHAVHGRGTRLFSKSAMLSYMIPRLMELFPRASFVHLYRNGPSVVASLAKKEFSKYQDRFTDEQDFRMICADYWQRCILEIEHRRAEIEASPQHRFLEFAYEDLCADPEATLTLVAEFLDVDPNDFRFDLSSVRSTNYKVEQYRGSPTWAAVLERLAEGMQLKGYSD